MLIEPTDLSGKSLAPTAQARLPAENRVAQKGKEDVKSEKEPEPSRVKELVLDVQKNLNTIHDVDLQFKVHEASGQIMVKVTDGSTGELIREIPPSEILNLAAKLDEMMGLIFDQKG